MRGFFYVLIVLSLTAGWVSDICNGVTVCLVGVFIALGLAFEFFKISRPRLNALLGVFLFVSLLLVDASQADGFQGHFLHFCLDMIWTLLGYRALSHQKTTERVQVGILAMIPLICVAYVLPATQFLLFLLAYFLVLFSTLAMQSLSTPTTGSAAGNWMKKNTVKTPMRPRFGWKILGLLFLPIIVGWGLFFIVPRAGADASVMGLGPQAGAFPDVSLNKTGKIELDPSLVFRVQMPDKAQTLYWRVEVQNVFDGVHWRSNYAPQTDLKTPKSEDQAYTLEFVRDWRDHRMPSIATTLQMDTGSETPQHPIRFYRDTADAWHRFGWNRAMPLTQVRFWLTPHHRISDAILDLWKGLLTLPDRPQNSRIWPSRRDRDATQRLSSLAQNIVGDATTEREKVLRIRDYLQSHFDYSLDRPQREGNIVEDFLFRQPSGHCEVFSTTMAVLVSRLHIPVRNVTGFVSSEFRDGYHLVRAAHAHSWVEVYLDGHWETFDPTPSGAQTVTPNLWLQLDDWFSTYKPDPIYAWIEKNASRIARVLLAAALLFALGLRPCRWVKKRLLTTRRVWDLAWLEVMEQCRKSETTRPMTMRSFESWWEVDSPELEPLQAFARQYILARFSHRDENTAHRFHQNHAIWSETRRVLRFVRNLKK